MLQNFNCNEWDAGGITPRCVVREAGRWERGEVDGSVQSSDSSRQASINEGSSLRGPRTTRVRFVSVLRLYGFIVSLNLFLIFHYR
jgi:hypothetical protein